MQRNPYNKLKETMTTKNLKKILGKSRNTNTLK